MKRRNFVGDLVLWGAFIALLAVASLEFAAAAPPDRPGERRLGGKPSAPITMRYTLAAVPALGQAQTVTVSITPQERLDDAVVVIEAGEGLALHAGPQHLSYPSLAAGQRIEFVIGVTPLALTTLRLNVSIAGAMHGDAQARTLSIPLRLGPPVRTPATLKVDASGQVLHALPAVRPPRGNLR